MLKFIARRAFALIPVLVVVTFVAFALVTLLPGDAALALLSRGDALDPRVLEQLQRQFGTDRPLLIRYGEWLWSVLHGYLGLSLATQAPVAELLAQRLPVTVILAVGAIAVSFALGGILGVVTATGRNGPVDQTARVVGIVLLAIPSFWLGVLLILLFAIQLRWLPTSGYVDPFKDVVGSIRFLVLPVMALAAGRTVEVMRQLRSSLLEAFAADYVRTARSKGVSEWRVVWRHALRNSLIPVVTLQGLALGRLIGGAVVIESVFAIPGLGRLAIDGVYNRDYAVVQGVVLVLTVGVVFANLLVDALYAVLDPQVRYE